MHNNRHVGLVAIYTALVALTKQVEQVLGYNPNETTVTDHDAWLKHDNAIEPFSIIPVEEAQRLCPHAVTNFLKNVQSERMFYFYNAYDDLYARSYDGQEHYLVWNGGFKAIGL